MKCCGNCFWSFTQEDEDQIEAYDAFDDTIPQAGDCCIGQDHGGTYCCPHHSYIEGMEEYEMREDELLNSYNDLSTISVEKTIDKDIKKLILKK